MSKDELIKKLSTLKNLTKNQYENLVSKLNVDPSKIEKILELASQNKSMHPTPVLKVKKISFSKANKFNLPNYCAQLKIDGIFLSLVYESGVMLKALTRGDGMVGMDVTTKVRHLVPATIPRLNLTEVRGELTYLLSYFQAELAGSYLTPRHAVFAALQDQNVTELVGAVYLAHSFGAGWSSAADLSSRLAELTEWQFKVVPHLTHELALSALQDLNLMQKVIQLHDLECDGLVFKHFNEHDNLFAVKNAPECAQTTVIDIIFQPGKTALTTPLILVEPTQLQNKRVTKISGHSYDYLIKHQVTPQSEIEIKHAGASVPIFSKTLKTANVPINLVCYECGTPLQVVAKHAFCENVACPAIIAGQLEHFMQIQNSRGLAKGIATSLVKSKMVAQLTDLFKLTAENLAQLPKFGPKKIATTLDSIRKMRQISLPNCVLIALGNSFGPAFTNANFSGVKLPITPEAVLAILDESKMNKLQRKVYLQRRSAIFQQIVEYFHALLLV